MPCGVRGGFWQSPARGTEEREMRPPTACCIAKTARATDRAGGVGTARAPWAWRGVWGGCFGTDRSGGEQGRVATRATARGPGNQDGQTSSRFFLRAPFLPSFHLFWCPLLGQKHVARPPTPWEKPRRPRKQREEGGLAKKCVGGCWAAATAPVGLIGRVQSGVQPRTAIAPQGVVCNAAAQPSSIFSKEDNKQLKLFKRKQQVSLAPLVTAPSRP